MSLVFFPFTLVPTSKMVEMANYITVGRFESWEFFFFFKQKKQKQEFFMHSFQIQFSYSRQVNERVMFGSYSWKLMMISCLTYKQIHKLTLVTVLLCDHLIEVCNDVHFQFENSQFYLWVNEATTTYMYIYIFILFLWLNTLR